MNLKLPNMTKYNQFPYCNYYVIMTIYEGQNYIHNSKLFYNITIQWLYLESTWN